MEATFLGAGRTNSCQCPPSQGPSLRLQFRGWPAGLPCPANSLPLPLQFYEDFFFLILRRKIFMTFLSS